MYIDLHILSIGVQNYCKGIMLVHFIYMNFKSGKGGVFNQIFICLRGLGQGMTADDYLEVV